MVNSVRLLVSVLFIFIIITSPPITNTHAYVPSGMQVHFIDVGQGDSILIQNPSDKTILIDGGPPKAGNKVVSYLKDRHIEEIDLVIATHPDMDHIGGLPQVMKNFEVKQIIDTGKIHITKAFINYITQIRKQDIPIKIAEESEQIKLDPLLNINILNAYDKVNNNNQSSIALKVSYGDVDFLLMSDVEKKQEKELMEKGELQAEIIKVAHHGSNTSTSQKFLQEVSPQTAILTYSKENNYGHPVGRVIENLNNVDATIFSTAAFGDLVISTNGESYLMMPKETPISKFVKSISKN